MRDAGSFRPDRQVIWATSPQPPAEARRAPQRAQALLRLGGRTTVRLLAILGGTATPPRRPPGRSRARAGRWRRSAPHIARRPRARGVGGFGPTVCSELGAEARSRALVSMGSGRLSVAAPGLGSGRRRHPPCRLSSFKCQRTRERACDALLARKTSSTRSKVAFALGVHRIPKGSRLVGCGVVSGSQALCVCAPTSSIVFLREPPSRSQTL